MAIGTPIIQGRQQEVIRRLKMRVDQDVMKPLDLLNIVEETWIRREEYQYYF